MSCLLERFLLEICSKKGFVFFLKETGLDKAIGIGSSHQCLVISPHLT